MQGFSSHHKRRCLYALGMSEEGKEKINSRVQRSPLLELTAQKFELKWVSARFTGAFSPGTVIVLYIYISKEQQLQRRNYPSHRTYKPSTLLHQVHWHSSCFKLSFLGLPFFQHFATAVKLLLLNQWWLSQEQTSWKAANTLWKASPVSAYPTNMHFHGCL